MQHLFQRQSCGQPGFTFRRWRYRPAPGPYQPVLPALALFDSDAHVFCIRRRRITPDANSDIAISYWFQTIPAMTGAVPLSRSINFSLTSPGMTQLSAIYLPR